MAFLESKLRSSDFPYSAMQNMYDANRNADLEREMMLMQLAREKEKMRQERMRTNKLSEERMRGTGDAPKAQDPMSMSAVEQQMYDKYDWLGRPSDAVKAINLIQARGQDPNVARQVGAGTIANMQGLQGRMGQNVDVPPPEMVHGAGTGYMRDTPADYPFLEQGNKEQLTRDLAELQVLGRVGAAGERASGQRDAAAISAQGRMAAATAGAGARPPDLGVTPEEDARIRAEVDAAYDPNAINSPSRSWMYQQKKAELEAQKQRDYAEAQVLADESSPEYANMVDTVYNMAPDMYERWASMPIEDRIAAYRFMVQQRNAAGDVLGSLPIIGERFRR